MFSKKNFVLDAAPMFPPKTAAVFLEEYGCNTISVTDEVASGSTLDMAGLVQNVIRLSKELSGDKIFISGVDSHILGVADRDSVKALLAEGKRLGNCVVPGVGPLDCNDFLAILSALDPCEAYDVAVDILNQTRGEHWIDPKVVFNRMKKGFGGRATGSALLTLMRMCREGKLDGSQADLENYDFEKLVREAIWSGLGLGFSESEMEEDLWCLREMLKITGKSLLPVYSGPLLLACDIPFVVFLNQLAANDGISQSFVESFARRLIADIPAEERYPLDSRFADSHLPRSVKRLLGREGLLQQTSSAAKALMEREDVLNGIYQDPVLAAELPELPEKVTRDEAREAIADHIAQLSQQGPLPAVLRSWINDDYCDEVNYPMFVTAAKGVREVLSWKPASVNWLNVLMFTDDENSEAGLVLKSGSTIPGSWIHCQKVEDQVAFIRQAAQFDTGLRDGMCRRFKGCLTMLSPEEWDPKAFDAVTTRSEVNTHRSARVIHRINQAYMSDEKAMETMEELLGFYMFGLPTWAKKPADMQFLYENRMLKFQWTMEMFAGPLWLAVRDLESRVGDSPVHFNALIELLMDTGVSDTLDMKTIVEMAEAINA